MVFYLIGLGLNERSISLEAFDICRKADRVYLDNYTVEFPYKPEKLEEVIGKRIIPFTRMLVEDERFTDEAKKKNIVFLVYGNPLIATTHISLILKCRKEGIEYKILQNASIFDAITETGLQIYKFGKTASMPTWSEKYKPCSFIDVIKNNQKIKSHTLLLVDIGLNYGDALRQFEEASKEKIKLNRVVVCSRMGLNDEKFFYVSFEELYEKEIYAPFCFIIPGELHFLEKEALEKLGG